MPVLTPELKKGYQNLLASTYRTPELMETSVDFEKHFVEMPAVAGPRRLAAQAVGANLRHHSQRLS
jgi:hypothetical protein